MKPNEYDLIINEAREVLTDRIVKSENTGRFLYTCPSPNIYPHQWLWDSAFHSIVWTYFDIENAKQELITVVKKQFNNGMIPHMSYWRRSPSFIGRVTDWIFKNYPEKDRSSITQPPVIGEAVEIVYEKSNDAKWLSKMIGPLIKYFNWFYSERNIDDDGLVVVIHPWETGMDMLPCWDQFIGVKKLFQVRSGLWLNRLIKRYNRVNWNIKKIIDMDLFVVKDVSFNVIYILGLQALTRLCEKIGDNENAQIFLTRSQQALKSLEDKSWNSSAKFYFDLYSRSDDQINELTVSGLFPILLYIDKKRAKLIIEKHILNKDEFWTNYPIPSVSVSSPKFSPKSSFLLWRGPTWLNTNWYLIKGLLKQGYKQEGNELIKKSIALINKSGLWEYYNPITGKGLGAKNLGWSTLIVDIIQKYLVKKIE